MAPRHRTLHPRVVDPGLGHHDHFTAVAFIIGVFTQYGITPSLPLPDPKNGDQPVDTYWTIPGLGQVRITTELVKPAPNL